MFQAIEQCVQQAEELEAEDKLTEAINLVEAGELYLACRLCVEVGAAGGSRSPCMPVHGAAGSGQLSGARRSMPRARWDHPACLPTLATPRCPCLQSWQPCRASTATTLR